MSVYTHALARQANNIVTTHEGGEAHAVDALAQLRRFLILGTENGSYYVGANELTAQSVEAVQNALDADPYRAINMITEVSVNGRAPKQEPALLALAMAASYKMEKNGTASQVRQHALNQLPQVARIGTHKFLFTEYVSALRGWGTALRRAIANLYVLPDPMKVAYDVTKYQQREGWSHRDLLRLAHPIPQNATQDMLFKYITSGELPERAEMFEFEDEVERYLYAVERAKTADEKETIRLIRNFKLPREVIATQHLNSPDVWEALLFNGMPLHAMLRNLGNMSKIGLLTPFSDAAKYIQQRLADTEYLHRSRVHPLDVIKAQFQYAAGQGLRGSGAWTPVGTVVSALEGAFYAAFDNVVPTYRNTMIALDVSSSMTWATVGNIPNFNARTAVAVMAMVTIRSEPNHMVVGFSHELRPLDILATDSLDAVRQKIARVPYGATECDLPMRYALRHNLPVEAFLVYTDSETRGPDPMVALRRFRTEMNISDAKLGVIAMQLNRFSMGDPNDVNVLNVAGFDTSVPAVLSEFIKGGG